ncbi:MAG: DUF58 domain-containing protein [Anaerolineae bacterium]|nr:DUF58 domain-containing protein [Anaerolineae bacterium]
MFNVFRQFLNRQSPTGPSLFDEAFLRRLERLALQPDRALRGGIVGAHRSLRRTPAPYMVDHRPYAPGDDLRYVDWHAYARHDHVFVKLGEAPQDVPVHLVIDHSGSMGWGDPPKLHAALRLAAAIGYIALAQGDRLTVTPFAHEVDSAFGPVHSRLRAPGLLRFLEGVQPVAGPAGNTQLAAALRHLTATRRGGLLVLISDLMDEHWIETLRPLRPPRWQTLVLHLLDRLELEPLLEDDLDVIDIESGARSPVQASSQTLALYRERAERWCDETQAACERVGAGYARILADWPIEKGVVPYLRRRRMIV